MNVTVVVPVGPRHREVAAWQLAALLAQRNVEAFEIIIADTTGAMRPPVPDRLSRCSSIEVVDARGRIGAGAVRNVGWRAASGDLIAFCDADDIASPDWLASHIDVVPRSGPSGGRVVRVDSRPSVSGVAAMVVPARPPEWRLPRHEGYPIADSANLALPRELLAALDGFDARYLRSQDVALSLAAHRLGQPPVPAPDAVMWSLAERASSEARRVNFLAGVAERRLRREFDLDGSLLRDLLRPARRLSRRCSDAIGEPPRGWSVTFAAGALVESLLPERGDAVILRDLARHQGTR